MTADPVSAPGGAVFSWQARWKSEPWTYADLERHTPPDSYGFEIVEGRLVVSPAPGGMHLFVVRALAGRLETACPPHLIVERAAYDFDFGDSTVQPDVFVIEPHLVAGKKSVQPPLLTVEVLSPSGRSIDLYSKRGIYQRAGVPDYWIVDPKVPSLLALHLEAGEYVEIARVSSEEAFQASTPFPVTVVPSGLLDEFPGVIQ